MQSTKELEVGGEAEVGIWIPVTQIGRSRQTDEADMTYNQLLPSILIHR